MKALSLFGALLVVQQATSLPFFDLARPGSRGDNWAVLVAGSDGWFNYRHQADVAHAYQLLTANGFPEENIILMMVDDVANHENNPRPGVLINQPGGRNVYKGIKVDYKGSDVTPEVFKKVLLGEPTRRGSNKTLGSGPNDNVFVNFVDHGATGLIAFPRGAIMTSMELVDTLKDMNRKRMYKNMVFFVEACEGGSMFDNLLPKDINVYAHTAAGPDQSSYATYWDSTYRTFLGDAYSVAWMEETEQHFSRPNPVPETLMEQFWKVYQRVQMQSQPQQYGDMFIGRHHMVANYLAYRHVGLSSTPGDSDANAASPPLPAFDILVDSRDTTVFALTKMLQENGPDQEAIMAQLEEEYRLRQEARDRFITVAVAVGGPKAKGLVDTPVLHVGNHTCLSHAVRAFHDNCHTLDDHHLPYTRVLAALCDMGYPAWAIAASLDTNPLCID